MSFRKLRQAAAATEAPHVLILGGGVAGLAAAYYASAAGYRVTLFERGPIGGAHGGSGGFSRIFRVMYSEASNARMAETSFALWRQLEAATGARLLDRTGLLFYGTDASASSLEGQLATCQKTMKSLGIPFERLERAELLERFPFRDLPADYYGLFQANDATLLAHNAMDTFADLARKQGATLLEQVEATAQPMGPDGLYRVCLADGREVAGQHLILCPGAWTNTALLPFGLQVILHTWVLSYAYWKVNPELPWPMFYEFGPIPAHGPADHNVFYGFPPVDNDKGWIKATADYTYSIGPDPDRLSRAPDPALLQEVADFLAARWTGVEPVPREPGTCLYAVSHDGEMIVGSLPGSPGTALFTGDSGRAFKFAPLLGRILVEIATTGGSAYDLGPWAITPTRRIFRR